MGDYYLPASASWYCSRVSDCYKDTFIFGAKRSLYLVKITSNPPKILGSIPAHHDRVVGVSLLKDPYDPDRLECCSAGEDGNVRVWDLASRTMRTEHSDHQHKLTCVHWSSQNLRLVASGDEKGNVVVWDIHSNERRRCCPNQGHIYCLEWSPHVPDYLAIGYRNGHICVVDTARGGAIIEQLRGHDDEVHSISWCPVAGEDIHTLYAGEVEDNPFADTPPDGYGPGYLLASGSRDRTLRIWSLQKGKSIQVHKLPTNTGHKFDRHDSSRSRAWVTVCWIPNRPRQLLSSGHGGEVMLWDLCEPGRNKWQSLGPGPRSRGHQRIVFNISIGGNFSNTACSISMDRQVVLWDLSRLEAQCAIPTMGGFVYSLRPSPLNPGRMAVGVGDNMLRVWNYSSPNNPYDHSLFWQGIKSKVTALAWHPQKEGLLAYGTDDGRVGIYDVLSGKAPQISSTYHRATVYDVTWGPMCPAKGPEAAVSLYSCGDGHILVHDRHRLENEAKNFNALLENANGSQNFPIRSAISWKPDRTLVAVGNEDGSLEVYRASDLRLMCCIRVHRKLINRCSWHPEFTAELSEPSRCRFWLAAGSNDCGVTVVDLQKIIEGFDESSPAPVVTEAFHQLLGHSDRITDLAWSPHREAMLASASYDGSAQVWNVQAGQGIANFRGHSGRVLTLAWSDLDPDIMYSGSEDFSLLAWPISGQLHKVPPKGKERKKKKKKGGPFADGAGGFSKVTSGQGDVVIDLKGQQEALQELLEKKRQELLNELESNVTNNSGGADLNPASLELPVVDNQVQLSQHEVEPAAPKSDKEGTSAREEDDMKQKSSAASDDVAESLTQLAISGDAVGTEHSPSRPCLTATRKDGKKWKVRSLMPLFSAKENRGKSYQQDDCSHLATYLKEEKLKFVPEEDNHLGLYMNRRCFRPQVQQELAHHKNLGNQEQEVLLELWKGNPGPPIRRAAEAGQLSDWLLGIASMASVPLWEEMCVKYAKQLEREGSHHKAASYLLAVHKVPEAVDVLARNRLFKDAASLAQLRLHPEEPQTAEVFLQWAASLGREGNHEQAAKCYLAAAQPLEAARQLSRRTDLSALKTATHVTLVAGELDAGRDYGSRYIQQCMANHDWYAAAEVIHWHECFKPLCLRLCVHELMLRELRTLRLYEPEPESTWHHSELPKDEQDLLPKFLVDPLDCGSLVLWSPHLIDGRAFMHEVLSRLQRQWHVQFDKNMIQSHFVQLHRLWETKQAPTSQDKVLLASTLEVTLGFLCLLRCDLDSTAHWWTVAMATCHEAGYPNLVQGIARLLLPLGPSHLGRLQQEVTAIRLAICNDACGAGPAKDRKPSLPASCMPAPMIKDDLSKAVSNNTRSCTSVDCLAAFYYLAVVQHLVANPGDIRLDDQTDSQTEEPADTECKASSHSGTCVVILPPATDVEGSPGSQEHASIESPGSTSGVVPVEAGSVKPQATAESTNLEQSLEAMRLSSYAMIPEEAAAETVADDALKACAGDGDKSLPQTPPKYILCDDSLKVLACSLLWDLHARRNHVMASLRELQRALARLQTSKNEQSSGCAPEVPDYLVAPPVLQRSLSGEYMHMKPGSPRVSPMKETTVSKRISNSSIDEEGEWMEMKDPDASIPESEVTATAGLTLPDAAKQGDVSNKGNPAAHATPADTSMTDSGILQTRICTRAHEISPELSQSGSEGLQNSDNADSATGDIKLMTGFNDNFDNTEFKDNDAAISQCTLSDSYSWRDLPIENKYCESQATVKDLTFEQIRLSKELHNLTCQIQSCPFPDPLPSAKMLITLSSHLSADPDFCHRLASWGLSHSITAEQREYFSTHTVVASE